MRRLKQIVLAFSTCLLSLTLVLYCIPLKSEPEQNYSINFGTNDRLTFASRGVDRSIVLWHDSGTAPLPNNPVGKVMSHREIEFWGIQYNAVRWPGKRMSMLQISMVYVLLGSMIAPICFYCRHWFGRLKHKHRTKNCTEVLDQAFLACAESTPRTR